MILKAIEYSEGIHRTTVQAIDQGELVKTKYGEKQTAVVTFMLPDGTMMTQNFFIEEVIDIYNIIFEDVATEIETDELLEKECLIEIEYIKSKSSGREYPRIKNVFNIGDFEEEAEDPNIEAAETGLDEAEEDNTVLGDNALYVHDPIHGTRKKRVFRKSI